MARFRFRAQAALDLRRREFEATERALARAEMDRDVARTRRDDAAAAIVGARRIADAAARVAASGPEREWHRLWLLRLEHELRQAEQTLALREQTIAMRRAECLRARQRCEALEKFREKAKSAFEAAEQDAERKVIDELATRRFAAARATEGAAS